MASTTSVLPGFFRWVFAILEVLCALAAVGILIAYLIDPRLPQGTNLGPYEVDFAGQPGTVALRAVDGDSDFTVSAFSGNIVLFVEKAGGLIEVAKHYGLPAMLMTAIFFIVLFDLLRRLFRNVGRGESFTRQSVTFVQFVGGAIIAYSLVSGIAEGWFASAMIAYLSQHATVTVSGTTVHLPPPGSDGAGFHFNGTLLFAGLLVLALSEVFRQGLVLKREHDLTV